MKKEGGGKTRFTLMLLGLSIAALVIVYATTTILGAWREREQTPRLAVDSLVKGLRTYQKQIGRFPENFRELESQVWKHKNPPNFGVDGKSLSVANYYYIYHQVDARTVTVWVIPTGPRRAEGSTHFLLLSPDMMRRWKGAPLSLDEIKKLPSTPQYREMEVLGMTEQPQINLVKR